MAKYYILSPHRFYNHGCRDFAVYEDCGDGTAICIEVESCEHNIHEANHQYQKLGKVVDVKELVEDRDYQRE